MKILGFTGSGDGLTHAQKESLKALVAEEQFSGYSSLHSNGVGADQEFEAIARARGLAKQVTDSPQTKIQKNNEVVIRSSVLIAAPSDEGFFRFSGSGTWDTVQYAWKTGLLVILIWPSGKVVRDARRSDLLDHRKFNRFARDVNRGKDVASVLQKMYRPALHFDVELALLARKRFLALLARKNFLATTEETKEA